MMRGHTIRGLIVFCFVQFPLVASTGKKGCGVIARSVLPVYQQLADSMRLNQIPREIRRILHSDNPCGTYANRKSYVKTIFDSLSNHEGKIGVLLSLSGKERQRNMAIIEGMHSRFRSQRKFNKYIVIENSFGSKEVFLRKLAELIFVHKVALIIGGGNNEEARILSEFSQKLLMPVILLTRPKTRNHHKHSFYVLPNSEKLANTLARYAHQRNLHRIGLLISDSERHSNHFSESLRAFASQKIEVRVVTYIPNDYQSMMGAAERLFKIDVSARKEEYLELLAAGQLESQRQGVAFQSRFVSLPPIIDVDAVFIPDHFRTVRHFVKIFRFLGVKKIPLLGNQQWRSQQIVEPPDPFLLGSAFVDYIGSYRKLPPGIKVPPLRGPYLVSAKAAENIDFQLMGYRSVELATRAVRVGSNRRRVRSALSQLREKRSRYFPQGAVFTEGNHARWPGFMMRINKSHLRLVGRYSEP